jgi:hypothetical protein
VGSSWTFLAGSTVDVLTRTATGQTTSFSAYAVLGVPAPVATVTIAPAAASVFVGTTAQLTVTLRDAANNALTGRSINWSSSDLAIATVSNVGVVTALVPGGPVTITALSEGQTGTASVTVTPTLSIVSGDQQAGQILQTLPTPLSVRLVDQTGSPRAGVPVTFTTSRGGTVANASPSTSASGVASPGDWTLGDEAGAQSVTASVGGQTVTFIATATGTATYFIASALAVAYFNSCALRATGMAACWGENGNNGNGGTINETSPTSVAGGRQYVAIGRSGSHTCATTAAGEAYCWGSQAFTDASGGVWQFLPDLVEAAPPWQQFSPGRVYNCGISTSQVAYCWGENESGQLGDGTQNIVRITPTVVAGGFTFTRIRSSGSTTCALTSDGSAYCWGMNLHGEVGDGTTTTRLTPTAVATPFKFRDVVPGGGRTCGITAANRLACWGNLFPSIPEVVTAAPDLIAISGSDLSFCGLAPDGKGYCWGQNDRGQLGDGTTINHLSPVPVVGSYMFSAISSGGLHSCGITLPNNSVACWGDNSRGQLGDGTFINRSVPRRIVTGVIP